MFSERVQRSCSCPPHSERTCLGAWTVAASKCLGRDVRSMVANQYTAEWAGGRCSSDISLVAGHCLLCCDVRHFGFGHQPEQKFKFVHFRKRVVSLPSVTWQHHSLELPLVTVTRCQFAVQTTATEATEMSHKSVPTPITEQPIFLISNNCRWRITVAHFQCALRILCYCLPWLKFPWFSSLSPDEWWDSPFR
jgi:hypothetical protein